MMNGTRRQVWTVEEINRRAAADPQGFVQEECDRYRQEVKKAADWLAEDVGDRRLVMLSGPSAAGKTTTAGFLQQFLTAKGIETHIVSLDDFYRGRTLAPLLPNGQYDYEALEALDLERLHTCMREILTQGRTALPLFDFHTGKPAPQTRELKIGHHAAVIFEGIHALNPIFEQHLPQQQLSKIFINTASPIYEGDTKLLARRQLRLVRRSLRDLQFRNSPLENTLQMWPQVARGETVYMFPYVDTADIRIDTTHAFEPCIFAGEMIPVLEQAEVSEAHKPIIEELLNALRAFTPLSPALMPANALLWEFVGANARS